VPPYSILVDTNFLSVRNIIPACLLSSSTYTNFFPAYRTTQASTIRNTHGLGSHSFITFPPSSKQALFIPSHSTPNLVTLLKTTTNTYITRYAICEVHPGPNKLRHGRTRETRSPLQDSPPNSQRRKMGADQGTFQRPLPFLGFYSANSLHSVITKEHMPYVPHFSPLLLLFLA
jgi:hypothetical protein